MRPSVLPLEVMAHAVAAVDLCGLPTTVIARKLGVHPNTLHKWREYVAPDKAFERAFMQLLSNQEKTP